MFLSLLCVFLLLRFWFLVFFSFSEIESVFDFWIFGFEEGEVFFWFLFFCVTLFYLGQLVFWRWVYVRAGGFVCVCVCGGGGGVIL